jgi:hypothetical protein
VPGCAEQGGRRVNSALPPHVPQGVHVKVGEQDGQEAVRGGQALTQVSVTLIA